MNNCFGVILAQMTQEDLSWCPLRLPCAAVALSFVLAKPRRTHQQQQQQLRPSIEDKFQVI